MSHLETLVKEFWKNHVQIGDWRHAWPPFFLHRRYGIEPRQACAQSSTGSHDHGIDAYHFELPSATLHLVQGKFTLAATDVARSIQAFRRNAVPFLTGMAEGTLDTYVLPPHLQKLHLLLRGDGRTLRPVVPKRLAFDTLSSGNGDQIRDNKEVTAAEAEFYADSGVPRLVSLLAPDDPGPRHNILTPEDLTDEPIGEPPTEYEIEGVVGLTEDLSYGRSRMVVGFAPLTRDYSPIL